MFNILRYVFGSQDSLINQAEANSSDAVKTSGASNKESLSGTYFNKLRKRIALFKAERQNLDADSTKIVIEKNILLNTFKEVGGFFFWRHGSRKGKMKIKLSDTVKNALDNYKPWHIFPHIHHTVLATIGCMLIVMFYYLINPEPRSSDIPLPAFIPVILTGIIYFWASVSFEKRRNKRNRSILEKVRFGDLIGNEFSTRQGKEYEEMRLLFDYSRHSRYYERVMPEMVSLAYRLGGTLGWVWKKNENNFSFDYETKKIRITDIFDETWGMVPFIETKRSLVFFVPNEAEEDALELNEVTNKLSFDIVKKHESESIYQIGKIFSEKKSELLRKPQIQAV